jgi:hypothetical protein
MDPTECGKVLALLRRFEAEAALDEARDEAARLAQLSVPVAPHREIVIDLDAIEAEIYQAA